VWPRTAPCGYQKKLWATGCCHLFVQELVVVVEPENIVADMHQAYQKITIDTDGYGVFIAGPSKTADIEQSLVIGAHGPLAMTVYLAPGASPQ
jgi:L-lactate dehydrogenase complex protein LldG